MGANYKSVRLTEEAYEKLARRKDDDETFSEVVDRLAADRPISELAGLFNEDDIERIRSRRRESYDSYSTNRADQWGK